MPPQTRPLSAVNRQNLTGLDQRDRETASQPFTDGQAQIIVALSRWINAQLLGQRVGVSQSFYHEARRRMLRFTKR